MWRLALIGTAAALLVAGGVGLWRFRPWPAAPAVEKASSQQMALPLALALKLGATASLEKPGNRPVVAQAPKFVYKVSLAGKSRGAGVHGLTDEIIQKLRDTNRRISNLPSDFFKNGGMKTALANRLSAAMRDISDARYPEAMRTLDHDVLQRMDGCAQTRKPDRNDWMMTCSAQENAYFLVTEAIDMLDELM
jgi:hypothetical protein